MAILWIINRWHMKVHRHFNQHFLKEIILRVHSDLWQLNLLDILIIKSIPQIQIQSIISNLLLIGKIKIKSSLRLKKVNTKFLCWKNLLLRVIIQKEYSIHALKMWIEVGHYRINQWARPSNALTMMEIK